MARYLIVGAGFAGAVHARVLAEHGHQVTVIDRRGHIGGNAFDFVDANGIWRHAYGPHLFHTSNMRVVRWLSRFCDWLPYEHRVLARLEDGRLVPFPVNRRTLEVVFDCSLPDAESARQFLARLAEPVAAPRNAAEYLHGCIGKELTDLFFRPYTLKMWDLHLEDMATSVMKRLSLRWDDDDRYFPGDTFQALPVGGYTRLFERIFDHPRIHVQLGSAFEPGMELDYYHCFNSMAIDEYFGFIFGHLPYRSIRFHHADLDTDTSQSPVAVINETRPGSITRQTFWHLFPGHVAKRGKFHSVTAEEPCDYRDNDLERYYPVRTADNRHQRVYRKYKYHSMKYKKLSFIGRCGTYQYLDMDQVINQSLASVDHHLVSIRQMA